MRNRYRSQIALLIAVVFVIGLCFVDAGAQRRKRRKARPRSAPAASPSPTPEGTTDPGEPRIVSTAGDPSTTDGSPSGDKLKNRASRPTEDEMRQTIIVLSNQVTKLSEKLSQIEEQQRTMVDLERLTRAEQRSENLSAQLRDVQSKEADLQTQLDQVEFSLQPENIERVIGTYGTTHPEEARDQRRRQLEGQRTRIQAQLDQLAQSRVRLGVAITNADAEVELLRKRVEALNKTNEPSAVTPIATPTPTPTPRPPR